MPTPSPDHYSHNDLLHPHEVNRASEELLANMEHVYDTTSKTKGDPLPFLGSGMNEEGFWEVFPPCMMLDSTRLITDPLLLEIRSSPNQMIARMKICSGLYL